MRESGPSAGPAGKSEAPPLVLYVFHEQKLSLAVEKATSCSEGVRDLL